MQPLRNSASALLQTLQNERGWNFQMLHALNMSVELHADSRPMKRQAEVSCLAKSPGGSAADSLPLPP